MTKEEFLKLAANRYDSLQALNKLDNFYDYEKEFVGIWKDLGQQVLETNIGNVPNDRRKKNFTTLGQIEISNEKEFAKGKNGFQISPLLQELMVYAGQQDCYGNSNEILKKFLDIDLGSTQVYRLTDTYGEQLANEGLNERCMPIADKNDTLYVELDGSMVLTREDGWKEVKLGRLFKSSDCVKKDGKTPGWIKKSQYLAYLGGCGEFTDMLYKLITPYQKSGPRLVFLSDGAKWIKNWIEDSFDGAVSILDYYHALEYLHEFAKNHFKDEHARRIWTSVQQALLLSSQLEQVMDNIEKLAPKSEAANKILEYYRANQDRMDYKSYKQMGIGIIGSGAIESAHRTVIQKRMKLSGQRWTKQGAQHMLNLRVVHMNGQWDKVIKMVNTEFKNVA